jgi:vitamin B12 transporter
MKTGIFLARRCAVALAVAAAFPVLAQSAPDRSLSEVVVTASRNPQLLSSVSAHTTVISRKDIDDSQATDLVSLLQREAGMQRTQNGGMGTTSTLFLRGMSSLDTLVLIDGIAQTKQDASGAVSLEHIMLDNVERVEIVRGNVSAIYGSGAIGGVIQIFTRAGSKESGASLSVEFGPRATGKLSASASIQAGDTSLTAGVSRYTTDGFSSVDPQQFATANPDADGYQNVSSNLSISHKLTTNHRFGIQVMQSKGDTNYDNYFGAAADLQSSTTRLNQASIFTDNTWGKWRSRLSLSEQSDKSITRDNGIFGSTNGFHTKASVLSWVNTLPMGSNWLVTAGAEEQNQHIDTDSTDPFSTPYRKDRITDAVFLGLEGSIGQTTLQLNLRNDKVGDLQQNTAYLGAGYALTSEFRVTASTSTAFNAPPLGYLYAPGFGNANLKPELATSKELGLQYEKGRQLLRVTYFDTRIEDQLTYDTATFAFANISRTRNSGLELSYRGVYGNTEVLASLTAQNPVDDITGKDLQRRARTMASFGIAQTIGAWRVGGDVRYSGERPDIYSDPNTFASIPTQLSPYSVVDLTASYRWSPQIQLKARLDNVTDERYQTVYGYNQQPRSLYAGLTWTPKR